MTAYDQKLLTQRSSFALWTKENVRFADMDMQGHANNAVYCTYLEMGRVVLRPALALRPPGSSSVLARQEVVYRRPVVYPSEIHIGTAVVRLGRTSYDIGQGIFQDEHCMATGHVTYVLLDGDGRSLVLPDAFREKLMSMGLASGKARDANG